MFNYRIKFKFNYIYIYIYIKIMWCKLWDQFIWRNIMRSTKSQKNFDFTL